jgi:hypothetical protein
MAAVGLGLIAAGPARADTNLTTAWTDATCGVIARDGTRTLGACSGLSFSALLQPGETAFVSATLRWTYDDDGLALDRPQAFQTDAFGSVRILTHESAGVFVISNLCQGRSCSYPPDRIDSFSGPNAVILGDNDVPDELTGERTFFASSGVAADWFAPAQRNAFLGIAVAFAYDGVNPVPELSTWALMLAGLGAAAWKGLRRRQRSVQAA